MFLSAKEASTRFYEESGVRVYLTNAHMIEVLSTYDRLFCERRKNVASI